MLHSTYSQVYVDVGRNLSALAMLVLRQADVLVAVFNPASSVVSHTAATLAYLRDEGIPEERFYLLSNRPLGMEDLSSEEVTAGLGRTPNASVPHLADNMYISNRLGRPLRVRFSRSNSTRSMQDAASDLASHIGKVVGTSL